MKKDIKTNINLENDKIQIQRFIIYDKEYEYDDYFGEILVSYKILDKKRQKITNMVLLKDWESKNYYFYIKN